MMVVGKDCGSASRRHHTHSSIPELINDLIHFFVARFIFLFFGQVEKSGGGGIGCWAWSGGVGRGVIGVTYWGDRVG